MLVKARFKLKSNTKRTQPRHRASLTHQRAGAPLTDPLAFLHPISTSISFCIPSLRVFFRMLSVASKFAFACRDELT